VLEVKLLFLTDFTSKQGVHDKSASSINGKIKLLLKIHKLNLNKEIYCQHMTPFSAMFERFSSYLTVPLLNYLFPKNELDKYVDNPY
jgi:hypothetical protein